MTSVAVAKSPLQKLKAPQSDGHALVFPSWEKNHILLEENAVAISSASSTILDTRLADLASTAKSELVKLARSYTHRYWQGQGSEGTDSADLHIVLAGHQPELFHPGVWFKNFALDRLAREHQAIGINLLIDNDLVKAAGVHVLSGTLDRPLKKWVSADSDGPCIPYEEREILSDRLFREFPDRVRDAAEIRFDLVGEDAREDWLLERLWPLAVEASQTNSNLGQCIAQARHRVELDLGLRTLEVPLSQICDTDAFLQFFSHILNHADAFAQTYNHAIREYRRVNHLRSQSHPAPFLRVDPEWIELPFWGWPLSTPDRQPIFCRRNVPTRESTLCLGDPESAQSIPFSLPCCEHASEVPALGRQRTQQGIKIRSRALVTTMFARLFLSDLFIHGIGGAKYDVVTDEIIQRFFHVTPPGFVAASATFRPQVPRPIADPDDLRRISGLIRELWYHPEKVETSPRSTANDAREFSELRRRKKAAD